MYNVNRNISNVLSRNHRTKWTENLKIGSLFMRTYLIRSRQFFDFAVFGVVVAVCAFLIFFDVVGLASDDLEALDFFENENSSVVCPRFVDKASVGFSSASQPGMTPKTPSAPQERPLPVEPP